MTYFPPLRRLPSGQIAHATQRSVLVPSYNTQPRRDRFRATGAVRFSQFCYTSPWYVSPPEKKIGPMLNPYAHHRLPFPRKCLFLILGPVLLGLATGCSGDQTDAGGKSGIGSTNEAPTFEEAAELVANSAEVSWMAHTIGDRKIGYGSVSVASFTHNDRTLVWSMSKFYLQVLRFGEKTTQKFQFGSIETEEGQLLRYFFECPTGIHITENIGRIEGDKLIFSTTSQGTVHETQIDWSPEWGGPFATEQSLERSPMQPGERRTIRGLIPVINQAADTTLEASEYESTRLLDRTVELLRIRGVVEFGDGQNLETIYWTDRGGRIHKTYTPAVDQTLYLTSEQTARDDADAGTFDLGQFTVVKIEQPLAQPHQTRQVVYHVRVENEDPAPLFSQCGSQEVESIDENRAQITVQRVRPGEPTELSHRDEPPSPEDRQPNSLVQSDDQTILEMAAAVAPEEEDPWRLALALESAVNEWVQSKNFSQAFASAAEVAQSREGDCTEHAVLLAALCRARGLPARVAIGLVYFPAAEGFAYHMWNEVWIDDRWVPLDATLGQGGIGAAHLKLSDSNLAGASAFSAFLPVMQVMTRLEIEVVSSQ